ncbi:hypothetical protein BH10PSE4_BH10PSE4_03420 [soil metagenome]
MATLSPQDQAFVHAYSKLLVEAWTDPSFKSLLEANPTAVAKNVGLNPGSGTVTLEAGSGSPDVTKQIDAWNQGASTGKYILYVPSEPQLGVQSSGDTVGDTSYCCCCCPCCTCT